MSRFTSLLVGLILLCGWQQQPASANPIILAKQTVQLAFQLYKGYNQIKDLFAPKKATGQNMTEIDVKMFESLYSISEDIQNLKKDMDTQFKKLNTKLTSSTNDLFDLHSFIQEKYEQFLEFVNDLKGWDNSTLLDFVDVATSGHAQDLTYKRKKLHERLTQRDNVKESIISLLTFKNNTDVICVQNLSPQQMIHNLYKIVVEGDIKGFMMQMFAYDIKEKLGRGTFEKERKSAYNSLNSRMYKTFNEVKKYMARASREIWKCDPIEYNKDTFSKIQTFQAVVNFESDTSRNSCKGPCEQYEEATPVCKHNFCQKQPEQKRCHGKLRGCKKIGNYNRFCVSDINSDRRYEFIETTDSKKSKNYELKYGQKKTCPNELITLDRVGAGLSSHCDVCLCTCEDTQPQTDRYFSLNDAISDTYNNMVVTAVRIVKDNHVLYIQIQEGRLGANGYIDPDTVSWKAIENQEKFENLTAVKINNYEVTWDQNTVYLDDVEPQTERHEVITGLRFKKVGTDLKLEIERTAFDYTTGLLKGRSHWYSNEISKKLRSEVSLEKSLDPILTKDNLLKSHSNQYIKFTTTDLKMDVAQSTIPYIDLQTLDSSPLMPLSGVGLYFKGASHSGGFLALKLIHYDFTQHIKE